MENKVDISDQNTQQIEQSPITQPVQIQEKSKVNYWKISTLILALLFFGILGLYLFSAYKTNQSGLNIIPTQPPLLNEFVCSQDSDCVIGIQATFCCSCPKAVNRELVGTKDWEQYEFGQDYSSRQSKSCGGTVACKPCELPVQPICSSGKCQFLNQQNIRTEPANTKTGNPKLTTALSELYRDWSQSPAVATEKAKKKDVEIDGDRVKVTFIMSDEVTAKSALNTIVSLGGEVTANYKTWIDAWVPVISLEKITEISGVNQVREPIPVVPLNQK